MKLAEINQTAQRINLTEVFDSKRNLNWTGSGGKHRASFDLNGYGYTIHIDEYDIKLTKTHTLLDIGFSYDTPINADDTQKLTNLYNNPSEILGIVANGLYDKLQTMKYDIILFGAHPKNGGKDARVRVYDFLSKRYMKTEGMWRSRLTSAKYGEYFLLSVDKLSDSDKEIIDGYLNK